MTEALWDLRYVIGLVAATVILWIIWESRHMPRSRPKTPAEHLAPARELLRAKRPHEPLYATTLKGAPDTQAYAYHLEHGTTVTLYLSPGAEVPRMALLFPSGRIANLGPIDHPERHGTWHTPDEFRAWCRAFYTKEVTSQP